MKRFHDLAIAREPVICVGIGAMLAVALASLALLRLSSSNGQLQMIGHSAVAAVVQPRQLRTMPGGLRSVEPTRIELAAVRVLDRQVTPAGNAALPAYVDQAIGAAAGGNWQEF